MLIGKFKEKHPFLFVLLPVIALVLWSDAFFGYNSAALSSKNAAPLYYWIAVFFDQHRFWSVLLGFCFMIIQAYMFNRVIADKGLVDRNSQLPALFYIVLMSNSFGLMGLHPIWFANFFLIISLDKIFDVFNEDDVFLEVFNVGFFISIASLFYLPSLWFLLLLLASLFIYYLVNIRGILAAIMGFITPYMFLALYYFWYDKLAEKVTEYFSMQVLLLEFSLFNIVPIGWASIGVIGTVALVAIIRIYIGGLRDKPVRIRKRFHVLLAYFIIALITIPFAGKLVNLHQAVIMPPLAAILARFFQENKKVFWNEFFFTLLILLIIVGKLARL
jgi:hypothetical protein